MARRRLRDVLTGRSLDDVELGTGVWRRAHDRFRRAVDRYHQVIEPVLDADAGGAPGARDRLELAGARLAACLDDVRARCADAQARWPSDALAVPGAAGDAHRRLSRAATLAAQASEGATMVRVAARDARGDGVDAAAVAARCEAVERAVALVERELAA